MITAKQVFFWISNLKGHCFHGDKATIFYLTLEYYLLSVLSWKLYFLEIGPVHQTLYHLNVRCWKRWIQIFLTEKTP